MYESSSRQSHAQHFDKIILISLAREFGLLVGPSQNESESCCLIKSLKCFKTNKIERKMQGKTSEHITHCNLIIAAF